ncbi:Polar-differentiation response regulator DivK [compost metagenome]|jgi:CheY-like chemotaxis protein
MPFTILVVEDEELTMQIMSVSLRHRGHHVLEAVSPQQGLTLARVERPDIILMDMNFKNATFDGIEAIRRLKADPRTEHIPVVAHTASVMDYTERVVRAAGASGFIRKPFRRQELLDVIEAAIGRPLAVPSAVLPTLRRQLPV